MSGEYSTAKLPTGYTQVEYIQGTGTQYIDIGRKMYNNSEIELCFSFDDIQENCSIFGSRTSSTTNNFEIASQIPIFPLYLDFGNYSTSRASYNNAVINTKYICTISKSLRAVYDENHTLLASNNTLISANNTTPSNARIFDTAGGYSVNKLKGKVYYCKIWENGVLVRNMIPCKNPSNVAGLYDTVNGAFYTNAGTGSFIAGAEVETVYGVIPVADYKDICDAVREKTHTDALMLPPEVAAKIRSINPTPTPGGWVRPEGWPDLDAVDLTGFDGVYLTYDLSKTEGYGWIGLFATTADRISWTVERGHLEAGQFVAERTEQTASGGYFWEPLDDVYGTIQLWRVSASGHITELKFVPLTATNASNMNNNLQPCVERVGRLPYVGNFSSTFGVAPGNRCCGTLWMQHDKLLDVSSVTNMQNAWQNCYNLQSLDLSGWDVSSVTTLQSAWANCYSLQSLDLSGWDVSSVTNMLYAWASCYSLQSLNLSGWDTGSVTNLQGTWNACYSLQSLNLSGWDVSGVTNMIAAWENCYSLQSLNFSGWDVSSVTSLQNAWQNCNSLQSLDLSGWNVSSVTNLSGAWENCSSLQSINLSGWDVSHLSTNVSYPNGKTLTDYWPSVISVNQNYNNATALSIASLLRIIDSLPVVTGARTLTLGQNNKLKLTAEQIAVATQKGWTVA